MVEKMEYLENKYYELCYKQPCEECPLYCYLPHCKATFYYKTGKEDAIDKFYEKIRELELPIISHIKIEDIYNQLKE